jgi:hypothetical protein
MVPVGSNDGLEDHLPLVRHRQTMLRRQFAELFVGKTHNYWRRMIIKQLGAVSTEIFALPEMNVSCRP